MIPTTTDLLRSITFLSAEGLEIFPRDLEDLEARILAHCRGFTDPGAVIHIECEAGDETDVGLNPELSAEGVEHPRATLELWAGSNMLPHDDPEPFSAVAEFLLNWTGMGGWFEFVDNSDVSLKVVSAEGVDIDVHSLDPCPGCHFKPRPVPWDGRPKTEGAPVELRCLCGSVASGSLKRAAELWRTR